MMEAAVEKPISGENARLLMLSTIFEAASESASRRPVSTTKTAKAPRSKKL